MSLDELINRWLAGEIIGDGRTQLIAVRTRMERLTAELATRDAENERLQREFTHQNLKLGNAEKECKKLRELYREEREEWGPYCVNSVCSQKRYYAETEANLKSAAGGGRNNEP